MIVPVPNACEGCLAPPAGETVIVAYILLALAIAAPIAVLALAFWLGRWSVRRKITNVLVVLTACGIHYAARPTIAYAPPHGGYVECGRHAPTWKLGRDLPSSNGSTCFFRWRR